MDRVPYFLDRGSRADKKTPLGSPGNRLDRPDESGYGLRRRDFRHEVALDCVYAALGIVGDHSPLFQIGYEA